MKKVFYTLAAKVHRFGGALDRHRSACLCCVLLGVLWGGGFGCEDRLPGVTIRSISPDCHYMNHPVEVSIAGSQFAPRVTRDVSSDKEFQTENRYRVRFFRETSDDSISIEAKTFRIVSDTELEGTPPSYMPPGLYSVVLTSASRAQSNVLEECYTVYSDEDSPSLSDTDSATSDTPEDSDTGTPTEEVPTGTTETEPPTETNSLIDTDTFIDNETNRESDSDIQAGTDTDCSGTECPPGPCADWELSEPEFVAIHALYSGDFYRPVLSQDNLTLYFSRTDPTNGDENIYAATREDRGVDFVNGTEIRNINSASSNDGTPYLTKDGLTLYFQSERPGGLGDRDLMVATRTSATGFFFAPVFVTGLNSAFVDHLPWMTGDELTLFFVSNRGESGTADTHDTDIWMATREHVTDGFGNIRRLSGINSDANEGGGTITEDGLTLYFASDRMGTLGNDDLWVATRPDVNSDFDEPENLSSLVNSADHDRDPSLSSDGQELFFSSERDGKNHIWRCTRTCIDP